MRSTCNRILIILFLSVLGTGYTLYAQCVAEEQVYGFNYDGHKYEVIRILKTWSDAAACAVERGGYLAEIGSREEQDTIYGSIMNGAGIPADYTTVQDGGGIAYVWIGATDRQNEGSWIWDGDGDSSGINFWNGQGLAGIGDGAPVEEMFINWGGSSSGTPNEPDDYLNNQDGGAIGLAKWPAGFDIMLGSASEWNDISSENELYFVVEYDCIDTYTFIDYEIVCEYQLTPELTDLINTGDFLDTIKTSAGCDSVIEIYINLVIIDTTVIQNEDRLNAVTEGAEYRWLDCNNNYAVIEGATGQSFTPSLSGSYAVEITVSGCADTSSCHLVITPVGIARSFRDRVRLSRVTGSNEFILDLGKDCMDIEMQICDLTGRIIFRKTYAESRELPFELKGPPGIYLVTVRSGKKQVVLKVAKN